MLKIKTVSKRKLPYGIDARVLIFQNKKLAASVIVEVERGFFGGDDNVIFTTKYPDKKNKKRS
jgi:hypothetical protein